MASLLPLNSTELERGIEYATDEVLPVPLRTLFNPDTCPVHLLPYLAWECSVDRWDYAWSEAAKRGAIRSSFYIHAHKGTIGALRRVVEPLGYLIEVIEWWQTEPAGVPGTFALRIGVLESGITDEMYQALSDLIDDAKPVSRHMIAMDVSLAPVGTMHFGVVCTDGDELSIDPLKPPSQ